MFKGKGAGIILASTFREATTKNKFKDYIKYIGLLEKTKEGITDFRGNIKETEIFNCNFDFLSEKQIYTYNKLFDEAQQKGSNMWLPVVASKIVGLKLTVYMIVNLISLIMIY